MMQQALTPVVLKFLNELFWKENINIYCSILPPNGIREKNSDLLYSQYSTQDYFNLEQSCKIC